MRTVITSEANGWNWKIVSLGRTLAHGWVRGAKREAHEEATIAMARLSLKRDLDKATEQIRKTIEQSVLLELDAIKTPSLYETKTAIKRGIEQAARNIAQALEEYGR